MSFQHIPVLLHEVLQGLDIKSDGVYVDCTLGGAGHAKEIIQRAPQGRLIGIDQDEEALEAAKKSLQGDLARCTLVHENFSQLSNILDSLGVEQVDGILMDIGVSSHQFDVAERGFSYRADAPLDMRMNQKAAIPTAADLLAQYSKEQLEAIFYRYGEEKWSSRIAEFVVKQREIAPIRTTGELISVFNAAVPKAVREKQKHPEKRIFQALRIEVNHELDVLELALEQAVHRLRKGGRLCVITFHSLEDRCVKNFFKKESQGCICPPDFPMCVCHHKPSIRMVQRKPIEASKKEQTNNSRAHSAKLRIAEKI